MQISEENKALIEETIQGNELYIGNEHLFEKFYKEISIRTYLVLSSKPKNEVKEYLKKVSQKVINDVLNREKASIEYKEMLQNASNNGIVSLKNIAEKEIKKSNNIIDFRRMSEKNFANVKDPIANAKNREDKTTIQSIIENIYLIHTKNPSKYYFQIFYLKYYSQLKQDEIAKRLNITQSELSLRFCNMLDELQKSGIKL